MLTKVLFWSILGSVQALGKRKMYREISKLKKKCKKMKEEGLMKCNLCYLPVFVRC